MMRKTTGRVARAAGSVAVLVLVLGGLAGCSKKDPTLEAAPPPSPNAMPERDASSTKQMPGRQPTGMGAQTR